MTRSLRIGFIGLGNQAAENLLPSVEQLKGAHLAAVCDIDPYKIARFERSVGTANLFSTIHDMLQSDSVDLVVMSCSPQIHTLGAKLAIDAGIPVFVEKPPCTNLTELLDLADRARERRVTTGVGLNFRFAEPVRRATQILNSNRFGGLAHLDIRHFTNEPRAPMWGLDSVARTFVLAQTIHVFDLAVALGGDLKKIEPEVSEVREGALIIRTELLFANGASASILTGSASPSFEFAVTAIGRNNGVLSLDNLWTLEVLDEVGGAYRPGEKRWSERWHTGPLESGYARPGYLGELQSFVDAVQNRQRFEIDFASLIPTYEIIESIAAASVRVHGVCGLEVEHV